MWTLTRLFCILFFYLQVSERFMNKQQTLIIFSTKTDWHHTLVTESNYKINVKNGYGKISVCKYLYGECFYAVRYIQRKNCLFSSKSILICLYV